MPGGSRLHYCTLHCVAALVLCLSVTVLAAETRGQSEDLTELSIEELIGMKVTSVSRKAQKLFDTPGAVYVLSHEDIQRSGVQTIPDLLRMVPGIQVSQINSSTWAISSRGIFDVPFGSFANKLLVLIDGRSVYTPLFSGVYWHLQDVMLEDVERIEVIRGPGGTIWGANAVNGVINIITRSAEDTQQGLITAGGGTEEKGFGSLRYGNKIGKDLYYRVYGKYFQRDSLELPRGGDGHDEWDAARGGFRLDYFASEKDTLTLMGDGFDGARDEPAPVQLLTPFYKSAFPDKSRFSGADVLGKWQHTFSSTSDMILQLYYDGNWQTGDGSGRSARNDSELRMDTFDLDFQHRFRPWEPHEVVWGAEFKFFESYFKSNGLLYSFDKNLSDYLLVSCFLQDDFTIIEKRLHLIFGSKLEYNDYTGAELLPSAQLLWTPDERQTIWASAANVVRTPSRIEHDPGSFVFYVMPQDRAHSAPTVFSLHGNRNFSSENLLAWEFGYRAQPMARLFLDTAFFYNIYEDLRTVSPRDSHVSPFPIPHRVIPLLFTNQMDGEAYGAEVAANLDILPCWRVRGSYSFLDIYLDPSGSTFHAVSKSAEGLSPRHIFSLWTMIDLPWSLQLDADLRYVDSLSYDVLSLSSESYVTIDARLGWRPRKDLEIAIVGRNLVGDHREFPTTNYSVERGVYGLVRWRF